MIKAIVFDCWNTLFFTDLELHPFQEFAQHIGNDFSEYSYLKKFERNFMTKPYSKLEEPITSLLNEIGVDSSKELIVELKEILEKTLDNTKAYPNTIEIISNLKREYKIGMITNIGVLGERCLNRVVDINNYFDIVVKSYKVGLVKPNPEIFKIMTQRLGLNIDEVLMVGDSLQDDALAAKNAGMHSVLIDRLNKHPEYGNRIISLSELPKYIKTI